MESSALAEQKIPRKDLVTGVGTSFLVHVLVFSIAFIWGWVMPHKPLTPPYCTVNLVSLKDLGIGTSEPKGSPKAAEEAVVSENTAPSPRTSRKAEPVAPIKRLAFDEAVKRPETQIKKIEPKEVLVAHEKPQSLEAIEKNLDKLIAKPKVIPHTSSAVAEQAEPQPKNAAPAGAISPREKPAGKGKNGPWNSERDRRGGGQRCSAGQQRRVP